MIQAIFTSDYEVHGNGDGCPMELMVEPTNRMMEDLEGYGAKLTIMADIGEILAFKRFKDSTGKDRYHYTAIENQLKDAIRRGHDVQLHIHSSWFNAEHRDGKWHQDWSEYSFAHLSIAKMREYVRVGIDYLESLLKPIRSDYRVNAFRAANWSMQPSRNAVHVLRECGITIDTSVFKYGRRSGIVEFDYSDAKSQIVPWEVDPDNVCREQQGSGLWEYPIYCENRYLPAFLNGLRIRRVMMSRRHRIKEALPQNDRTHKPARAVTRLRSMLKKHAWKADFNQCQGRQLIRAIQRVQHGKNDAKKPLPFVLIGHSKLYNSVNSRSLKPFLNHLRKNQSHFGFGTF